MFAFDHLFMKGQGVEKLKIIMINNNSIHIIIPLSSNNSPEP